MADDEQELRHETVLQAVFAGVGRGLSPALCEYNERAATVRTPARDKNIDAPDPGDAQTNDRALYDYIYAFRAEGAKSANLLLRNKSMLKFFRRVEPR